MKVAGGISVHFAYRVISAVTAVAKSYGTFNGWGKADSVIDHIFFRGAEAHTFKVLRDKNYGAPFISDHYPVVMTATF